jgi:uncharacterized iron-regulated membrane protein
MTIRKIFFWLHLCAGTLAGVVILLMCVTGAALGFEKQVLRWAERNERSVAANARAQRLPMESLLTAAPADKTSILTTISWHRSANSTVEIGFRRDRIVFLDPFTGAKRGEGAGRLRAFFSGAENVHRWLGADGSARPAARAITGAANLIFLFLACSGLYLWWPRSWRWSGVRSVITFRGGLGGRARDFNWHNTIGFWMCMPLVVIVTCSTTMSYQWANNLVYRLSGSPLPVANSGQRPVGAEEKRQAPELEGLDALCATAEKKVAEWQTITMRIPGSKSPNVTFQIDAGDGGRPDKRSQLTLNRQTGEEVRWEPLSTSSRGRQIRAWMRFVHTGEAGGAVGQSIASVASIGGIFLAYTGISMAIRRFLSWRSRAKLAMGTGSGAEPATYGFHGLGVVAEYAQSGGDGNCEKQPHTAPHPSPEEQRDGDRDGVEAQPTADQLRRNQV